MSVIQLDFSAIDENWLPAPKSENETLPDWARVALAGWGRWKRFWGIEVYREHPLANRMIELGLAVPPPVEDEALRNLELYAKSALADRGAVNLLSPLEQELLSLEKQFMAEYEKPAFYVRYATLLSIPRGENVQAYHRFKWIAYKIGYMKAADVRAILEEVSKVLGEYAELQAIETAARIEQFEFRLLVKEVLGEQKDNPAA